MDLTVEDVTNKGRGRIDLTVKINDLIYITEFRVDGEGWALEQIKARNYQEKNQDEKKTIYLIRIDFDSQQKNVAGFKWERV